MSRITSTTQRRAVLSLLSLALAAVSPTAYADNLFGKAWTVNMAQSKFSNSANILVLERNHRAAAATSPADAGGNIVVISHGNIYLGTPDASSGSGMALEQIGERVHVISDCGTWCRQMRPNNRLVLSFTSIGAGPHDMGQSVVLNTK